eukprot:555972-Pelagomonas_calceolata.AAC.10
MHFCPGHPRMRALAGAAAFLRDCDLQGLHRQVDIKPGSAVPILNGVQAWGLIKLAQVFPAHRNQGSMH